MAWPTAEVAVMGAPGAVQILHRRQLAAIDDDAERMAEQLALEAEYSARFANPYVAAERGYVDDVIAPSRTRPALITALEACRGKRIDPPHRKHGNIPL
jgi:propionyl-CoA carboxylase beta chain